MRAPFKGGIRSPVPGAVRAAAAFPPGRQWHLTPPDEDEAAPHIVSVDQESGLPVRVEVLHPETGQVFTVIEFYDCDAPITLEFPKCDKER